MQELWYILFFLAYWFVIPYLGGTWFFKRLKKRWRWMSGNSKAQKAGAYLVFLLCALIVWLIEMLTIKGVLLML